MSTAPFFAKDIDELRARADHTGMTGMELLQAVLDGTYPAAPIAGLLRFELEKIAPGEAWFRGTPGFDTLNPHGAVHGGWFGAVLDSCMACAVQTMLGKDQHYTTLEYKINIIRPLLADGTEVRGIGTVSHVGRRTGIAEGRLVGVEDGKLYATGSTTCLVLPSADGTMESPR